MCTHVNRCYGQLWCKFMNLITIKVNYMIKYPISIYNNKSIIQVIRMQFTTNTHLILGTILSNSLNIFPGHARKKE